MPNINPHIGTWASGEPIDLTNVPLVRVEDDSRGAGLVVAFDAKNGGTFTALYLASERRDDGRMVYSLDRVEEIMPPDPPQIRGFGNDVRLPMMDRWGFSAALEAERRLAEWAEVRVA